MEVLETQNLPQWKSRMKQFIDYQGALVMRDMYTPTRDEEICGAVLRDVLSVHQTLAEHLDVWYSSVYKSTRKHCTI